MRKITSYLLVTLTFYFLIRYSSDFNEEQSTVTSNFLNTSFYGQKFIK